MKRKSFRITILKKNQIIVGTIALMLIVAGYLNYSSTNKSLMSTSSLLDAQEVAGIGDATLVSSDSVIEQEELKIDYFTQSRLERQTMYSQMTEEYNKVLQNTNIGNEQKAISQNEIIKLNNSQNAIMIAENLIKIKGFEDVIIFVNADSVNVIVKAKELSTEQIAQIQNIVCREMGVKIENIHILIK